MKHTYDFPKVYAVWHNNMKVRMNSRSGGMFTALSDKILEADGVVFGCVLTENGGAVHIQASTKSERDKMRGSKYVQSDLQNVFQEVKSALTAGKSVLFSGTSCQVDGLNNFIGENEQLYCIDIVCHGVPSPLVWERYLRWKERKYGKCVMVDFRNKKDYGWREHVETLEFRNKQGKTVRVDDRTWTRIFYEHSCMRPCCYKCPYKSVMHPGNITIADYWGIEKAAPGFDDNKGTSLVLINDEKGAKLFSDVANSIRHQETSLEDSMQTPLIQPFEMPLQRGEFWKDLRRHSFGYIAYKYVGTGPIVEIKQKIKKAIKTIFFK